MTKSVTLKTLRDAQKRVNENPALRRLGSCDATFGIRSGDRCYAVKFAGFECNDVSEIDADRLQDVDFYIDMDKADWTHFLESQASESPVWLNDLDLAKGVIKSFDARNRLRFTQYHQSFQLFFNATASATANATAG